MLTYAQVKDNSFTNAADTRSGVTKTLGAKFTCFTNTSVQRLTPEELAAVGRAGVGCFAGALYL